MASTTSSTWPPANRRGWSITLRLRPPLKARLSFSPRAASGAGQRRCKGPRGNAKATDPAPRKGAARLPLPSTISILPVRPTSGGRRLLVEGEAVRAQVAGKSGPFRPGGLPRLVLRPAVKLRLTVLLDQTLLGFGNGVAGIAPSIVVANRLRQSAIVVGVTMQGHVARQAHTDVTAGCRIADADAGHREHLVGQRQ